MTRISDYVLVLILAFVFAWMSLMHAGPDFLSGDTVLLTIMSLQKVTLFAWGQNRFLNFTPAVASFLRTPDANLLLQALLYGSGMAAFLALLGHLTARAILRSEERVDAWLCFALLLFAFVVALDPHALHRFSGEAQPYGLSYVLMGIGLLYFVQGRKLLSLAGVPALLAMVIAGGLNPSLLIVTSALCACIFVLRPDLRLRAALGFVLAGIASGLWLVISWWVPGPQEYGDFNAEHISRNIGYAIAHLESAFAPVGMATIALASLAGIVATLGRFRIGVGAYWDWKPVALVVAFCLCWFLFFSQNGWVIANHVHFRYFFPIFVAVPLLFTAPVAAILRAFSPRLRVAATVVAFLSTMAMLVAPYRPFDEFRDFARVAPHVEAARERGIRLVAGDYWYVWPSVFLLMRDGPAFGMEDHRAYENREAVRQAIVEMEMGGAPARAICVGSEPAECVKDAEIVSEFRWQVASDNCGEGCGIIERVAGQ